MGFLNYNQIDMCYFDQNQIKIKIFNLHLKFLYLLQEDRADFSDCIDSICWGLASGTSSVPEAINFYPSFPFIEVCGFFLFLFFFINLK